MQPNDSKARFSDRVADYVRHRPDYPPALLAWLRREHGLTTDWRVADIGAGTGISSKILLDAGHSVVAVEPNAAMRAAATRWLGGDARYAAVDGSAEATALNSASASTISSLPCGRSTGSTRSRYEQSGRASCGPTDWSRFTGTRACSPARRS